MSQKTHNTVRDYFHDELVEETPLKGKTEHQRIYNIRSERPGVRTRFQAGMVRGITELVGRGPEMEALKGALQKIKKGAGQVVDVVGEAGVGKSRLAYEFQRIFEEEVMFRILCSNEKVGSIIGKGGIIVRALQGETGAIIKVIDAVPDCEERVIAISAHEVRKLSYIDFHIVVSCDIRKQSYLYHKISKGQDISFEINIDNVL